jgi:hypothetical protein
MRAAGQFEFVLPSRLWMAYLVGETPTENSVNIAAFGISLIFSILGIFLVSQGDADGWLGLGFFGLCSVIGAICLLPKRWFAGRRPRQLYPSFAWRGSDS